MDVGDGGVVGVYPTMYPLLLLPVIVVIVAMVDIIAIAIMVAIDHHCFR